MVRRRLIRGLLEGTPEGGIPLSAPSPKRETKMVNLRGNPIKKVMGILPKSQVQFESELKVVLKYVFWVALLAPVILVPAYYLLVAFGLAPSIHLPG